MDDANNDEAAVATVTCASYTHARRYPLVIGKIGGFPLPSPLSPAQVIALLGSFFILLFTRGLWGVVTPGLIDAVLMLVIPGGLAWAVRHLRMEGRSPLKMLGGVLTLALAPPHGTVRGRQLWSRERKRLARHRIYIVGDTTSSTIDEPISAPVMSRQPNAAIAELVPHSPWACLTEEAA